jgi:acyl-CoA synthetase (AMP-forming)/AMP-acid ligase II
VSAEPAGAARPLPAGATRRLPAGASRALPAGAANRVVARGWRGNWSDLPELTLPPVSAVLVDDNLQAATAAWQHARSQGELLLAATRRVPNSQAQELADDGFAIVRAESTFPPTHPLTIMPTHPRPADPGRLWLLTSGSTGRPKRVAHTLASLTTVGGEQPPRRWLCPYSPGAYAWWQVVTLSLAHPGQDVVFVETDALESWPETALAEGVTAASGTPTFFRQALWRSGPAMARLPLEQITLGGEPVDQAILDQLTALFPAARVSWIYASSEAGASIAVHDGRAGFPIDWLDRSDPARARLSVRDHELLIESRWSADGMDDVLHTGDRVEVVDGRVLITGRIASDEINVGGAKVSAASVRGVLLSHPAVVWAHVKGRRAPIVGQVVAAQLVLAEQVGEQELTAWCAERLPDYAVPRRLQFLAEIPIKETLKSDV